jgi:flagellar basal-body rod protein FlgB
VANIETPGYKTQDFSFETLMGKAMQNTGELARTNPKHLQLDPLDISAGSQFTSEGRPVDLDEEMMKLSENQLMYQIAAKIVAKKLEGLSVAIDEGGK